MQSYEEYARRILERFQRYGELPTDLRWDFPEYSGENDDLVQVMHYLQHVITDKDLRDKDPELDEFMRDELSNMIAKLDLEIKGR